MKKKQRHKRNELHYQKNVELMRKIKRGDPRAREEFIFHNAGLVGNALKSIQHGYDTDLCAIGMSKLITLIDRYDPKRGYTFSSFAYRQIWGAMINELNARKR